MQAYGEGTADRENTGGYRLLSRLPYWQFFAVSREFAMTVLGKGYGFVVKGLYPSRAP